jgi:hypothetical protein
MPTCKPLKRWLFVQEKLHVPAVCGEGKAADVDLLTLCI